MQTHPAPVEAWTESIVKSPQTPRSVLCQRGRSLIDDVQVNYRRNTAKAGDQLEYIRTKIEEIRARAFVKAEKALRKQAPELIDNENQWSKKLLSELTGEAKSAFSDITEAQAQKLLKNSIQINKTWDHYEEYKEIKTETDIENLLYTAGGFHDAFIAKEELKEDGTLYLLMDGT